jgi:hypothetical protein
MKGVKFVIDENGEQSAVLIDLKENAELWEDFYDAYVAREREGEPRESIEEVRQKLQTQGKLHQG